MNLDVQQFKPEEIDVKIVDDYLVVEAKHEERADKHGFISRQFTRRYKLSENLDLDAIKSTISSDGILLITAPKKVRSARFLFIVSMAVVLILTLKCVRWRKPIPT